MDICLTQYFSFFVCIHILSTEKELRDFLAIIDWRRLDNAASSPLDDDCFEVCD